MQRIIELMAEEYGDNARVDYDFVLVAGHFLMRDENIFTYFEGQGVKVEQHGYHGTLLNRHWERETHQKEEMCTLQEARKPVG